MRKYIFTSAERNMVKTYLKSGRKRRHFNVLLSLIRRNQDQLEQDIVQLRSVRKKADQLRRTGKRKAHLKTS